MFVITSDAYARHAWLLMLRAADGEAACKSVKRKAYLQGLRRRLGKTWAEQWESLLQPVVVCC